MGLKRLISIMLSFLLILALIVPVSADPVIALGRISVVMPQITVELKGSGYDKNEITAALEAQNLSVLDAVQYDPAVHSTCTYILVDLSTSMYPSFERVKKNIVSYIQSLGPKDSVVLITFGETVETLLTGEETAQTAAETVSKLRCNADSTLFYEALSRAYQLSNVSNSGFDREYVIAFSDGIDEQRGSATFDEALKLYGSHTLPLYAACSDHASKDGADRFGELARASGGQLCLIEGEEDFTALLEQARDVTLVSLQAATNHADGKEKQLSLKVGDSQVACNVPVSRSIPDASAPTVTQLHYDAEKDMFVLTFSEPVSGAADSSAYKITDSKGNLLEVSEVFYAEAEYTCQIKTKDPVYKDTYTFAFFGIKDISQEENALADQQTVCVEQTDHRKTLSGWLLTVILAAVVLVAGLIVLLCVLSSGKKRSDKEDGDGPISRGPGVERYDYDGPAPNIVQHHIKAADAARIRLRISTGKTAEQTVEVNILSSLIVGRSDTCDIYIDDTKLSRQHFVIEHDSGAFYVMDLQSRNGTMVNGIRINGRQPLHSGDKILAGLSDIGITILGR